MQGFDGRFGILVIADRTPAGRQDLFDGFGSEQGRRTDGRKRPSGVDGLPLSRLRHRFSAVSIIPTEEQAYWYDIKSLKRFNAFVCTPYPVERRSHPCVCEYLKGGTHWAALPQPKQRRQLNARLDRREKPVSSAQARLLSSNFWKR